MAMDFCRKAGGERRGCAVRAQSAFCDAGCDVFMRAILSRHYFDQPRRDQTMTIKTGDRMPEGKLWELPVEWSAGCPTAADEIAMPQALKGKRIALFAVPGAYTRTCSAKHLPGYVQQAASLK